MTISEQWGKHLTNQVYAAYGAKLRLATPEAIAACVRFVSDAVAACDNIEDEIDEYVAWLTFSLKSAANRKAQYPPMSPDKACVDIAAQASKAAAWNKFKRNKATALKPQANPHLTDIRPPEAIATAEELCEFYATLKDTLRNAGASENAEVMPAREKL